jgi:hypothetical protein
VINLPKTYTSVKEMVSDLSPMPPSGWAKTGDCRRRTKWRNDLLRRLRRNQAKLAREIARGLHPWGNCRRCGKWEGGVR